MKQLHYLKESLDDFRKLTRDHADDGENIVLMFDRRNGHFWVDETTANSWVDYGDDWGKYVIDIPVANRYCYNPYAMPCSIKSVTRHIKALFPEYCGRKR